MDIVLIAMPWADATCPQASIGALAAYLRQRRPDWSVETRFDYLDVAAPDVGFYQAIATADFEGERIYATLLYPEGAAALASFWSTITGGVLGGHLRAREANGRTAAQVLDDLRASLTDHLDQLVASRSWSNTVVGLTTSFSQLFANLALAQRIKAVAPDAVIVLGGSTVSPGTMTDSVLATYPWIDYVARGEGELPFHALCEAIEAGLPRTAEALPRGVASRQVPAAAVGMWQMDDLDGLPVPDYDAYYARVPASAYGYLPIEGSRGCWWDRTTRKTTSTCKFCNLNVQWDGFRQKSGARIAAEMRHQAGRYRKSHFSFLDNIVRVKGFDDLLEAIGGVDLEPEIFHEARANLRPEQILRFWDVGLRHVQFGLEGLSNRFLERIHKGTTALMNLEVMKTCAELGIFSLSNLIVDYPGSTDAEVDETVAMIDDFAFAYEPPNIAPFELGIDSVVARFPDDNHVANVRKHDRYRAVLPAAVLASLQTFQLSFDHVDTADWSPVTERVARWRAEFRPGAFTYEDGGSYLRITRRRARRPREVFELLGEDAAIYRACTRYRSLAELHAAFAADSADHAAEIDASLQRMVTQRLMYRHQDRYLAVAMAPDAAIAARRIRSQAAAAPPRAVRPRHLVVMS